MSQLHLARSRARLASALVLVLGLVAVLPAASARALPVVATGSGVFADPVIEGGGVFRGEDTSHLSWGSSRRPRHALGFAGSRIDADSDGVFSLGTLRYRNGKRASGAANVDLLIRLAVATPGGEEDLGFALSLVHTPGASGPDGVLVAGDLPVVTFSFGGTEYTLELLGLQGDAEASLAKKGKKKSRSGSAQILARIATSSPGPGAIPNPEPDAALLYLLGLGLVGARLRRRRA